MATIVLESDEMRLVLGAPIPIGSGEANTAANVGAGAGVFRDKTGLTINLRSLESADGTVSVTEGADTVDLAVDTTQLSAQDFGSGALAAGQAIVADGVGGWSSSSIAPSPSRVLTVAQSGGTYTSIADALVGAAALTPAADDPVLIVIAPGTYVESDLTIPAHVNVMGLNASRESAVIDGTGGTATFNMQANSSIKSVTIQNGGYALRGVQPGFQRVSDVRALNTEGYLWDTGSAVMLGEIVRAERNSGGVGGVGFHATNGGIITGQILNAQGSAGNEFADGFLADGGSIQASTMMATFCQDGYDVRGGTGLMTGTDIGAADILDNGLHVNQGTVRFKALGVSAGSQALDVLIASAADDVSLYGGMLDAAKISINPSANFLASGFSTDVSDPGLRVEGELHVGSETRPRESAFGGGDSHNRNMSVFRNTNGESGTWSEITSDLKSNDGSFADIFPGVAAGNACYIGGDVPFPGIKTNTQTAIALGAGAINLQYWDGASWVDLPGMASDADAPYGQYDEQYFERVSSDQIRFGDTTGWVTKNLNGATKYWVRFIIATGIATSPALDQVKLHTNRAEFNADGFEEYFGAAEPDRQIPQVHWANIDDLVGKSPSNVNINISANIGLSMIDNRFNGSSDDGVGIAIQVPLGLDTSRPITVVVGFRPSSNAPGDIELILRNTRFGVGDVVDGSLPETSEARIISVNGQQNELIEQSFSVSASGLLPGSTLVLAYERNATGGNPNDTYTGNVENIYIRAFGTFWRT